MSGSAGVYVIRCVPSGEVYIGSSMDVQKRFAGHRSALGRGTHHNRRLQAAWDHYGEDSFEFEVLEAGLAEDALGDAEQSWILRLRARELGRGFNVHAYRSYRPPARARFAYRPGMTFVFAEPVGDGDAVGEVELELDLEETVSPGTLLVWVKTPADKTRLRMLGMLAEQKRSVEELAALLDLRPSTVSWHLARLKEIGLVAMQAEGNTHVYRLNGKGLGRINKLLAAPERVAMLDDVEAQA